MIRPDGGNLILEIDRVARRRGFPTMNVFCDSPKPPGRSRQMPQKVSNISGLRQITDCGLQ